jgi:hypothetical protein
MNIFFVDENPRAAARMLANAHVRSQLNESYKMLSAVHHNYDSVVPGMAGLTHPDHPCTRWVGDTSHNYNWLYEHANELCREYRIRWDVSHWYEDDIEALSKPPLGLKRASITLPPIVVSRDLQPEIDPDYPWGWKDVIKAYQAYYNRDKRHLHFWMGERIPPRWIKEHSPKVQPTPLGTGTKSQSGAQDGQV